MDVVVGLAGGVLLGVVLWKLMAPGFAVEIFTRQNFRERDLPTAVGVILALAALVAAAVAVVWSTLDDDLSGRLLLGTYVTAFAAVAFCLLGLFDDLGGVGQSGGFRGHLELLARGRLSTGAVKLFGGAAVGIVAVGALGGDPSIWRLLADAALVALAANVGNLFDRAPGRATKVGVLAFVLLLIGVGLDEALFGVAVAVGAAVGILWPDLREQLMLGDAGANVLGAVVGLGLVMTGSPLTRTIALVVVLALNAASEKISFSRVINQVAPLRAVDRLGREP